MSALLASLEDQPTGRRIKTTTSPEKEKLQHRVKQLKQQVQYQAQKEKLRQFQNQWAGRPVPPAKKTEMICQILHQLATAKKGCPVRGSR